jgi:hypothetical protein
MVDGIDADYDVQPGFLKRKTLSGITLTEVGTPLISRFLALAWALAVPSGPQDMWQHPPFQPVVEGDWLKGRARCQPLPSMPFAGSGFNLRRPSTSSRRVILAEWNIAILLPLLCPGYLKCRGL